MWHCRALLLPPLAATLLLAPAAAMLKGALTIFICAAFLVCAAACVSHCADEGDLRAPIEAAPRQNHHDDDDGYGEDSGGDDE